MKDDHYLKYCRDLLAAFAGDLGNRVAELPADDPLARLADAFQRIARDEEELYTEGPALVTRLFSNFPHFAPLFPRDLLWFFGGECLHFMPDEEITQHQQLEELRAAAAAEGRVLDMVAARAQLTQLQ
jgi:hypothetical protein